MPNMQPPRRPHPAQNPALFPLSPCPQSSLLPPSPCSSSLQARVLHFSSVRSHVPAFNCFLFSVGQPFLAVRSPLNRIVRNKKTELLHQLAFSSSSLAIIILCTSLVPS